MKMQSVFKWFWERAEGAVNFRRRKKSNNGGRLLHLEALSTAEEDPSSIFTHSYWGDLLHFTLQSSFTQCHNQGLCLSRPSPIHTRLLGTPMAINLKLLDSLHP
ncbi:hypothetical protein LR48_Vigan10g106300 [Vigna angularis]|uniref:Uncharacterized protein n=2 Tax=Phaseolus angularis TaxID=3914 RepID=A0A0S3S8N4_PHAAN|nr:hypothetical protein LR48_Vigan2340s000100 [Vigna angularis]KOM55171.1 hypothetical protein LR48_Vigan10g106300 [Vigna angularis]BAT89176.1 hypothetical protein VIGAN_06005900 [Vigna angularis var. angularis]BAU02252.1 hypothetical protein VIGAN_11173800 [Vigna angularis var. angularis]